MAHRRPSLSEHPGCLQTGRHATQLLGAGAHSKAASERLGDASIVITPHTSSHAMHEEAAEKIDAGLRTALSR